MEEDILLSELSNTPKLNEGNNNDDQLSQSEKNDRTLISDIQKIITISKILQKIGENVAPLLNETNTQKLPILEGLAVNGAEGVGIRNPSVKRITEHRVGYHHRATPV